jgi:hypothetical protein
MNAKKNLLPGACLLILSLLALSACSSSDPDTTGDAGSAGTSAGGAGTGGAAGSGSGTLPACLAQLLDECPSTSCTYQQNGQEKVDHYCYADGAVATVTKNIDGSSSPSIDAEFSMDVRKADGSLCYTLSRSIPAAHAFEDTFYTWKDASGKVVATATRGGAVPKFSILCAEFVGGSTCTPEVCLECDADHCPANFWPDHPCVAGTCP